MWRKFAVRELNFLVRWCMLDHVCKDTNYADSVVVQLSNHYRTPANSAKVASKQFS